MSRTLKFILWLIMTTALTCGFLHHVIDPESLNFERLHIFLFNLCTGGTLLIYFTEDRDELSRQGQVFLVLAITFALCAFARMYLPTLFIPLVLALIIERVRIEHFGSFIPWELITRSHPTSRKFHQASLLCLSLGLVISSLAILNSEYGQWFTLDKLKLDTFFLGFSFPVSLISMSVIFSLMKNYTRPLTYFLRELSFWIINLGVIVFFLFILAGWFTAQVVIASILFITVGLIFTLYVRQGHRIQQKTFLTSGILFLLITSISGIIYIFLALQTSYNPQDSLPLLRMHAFTALYGWNLSGLIVISRHGDFPIKLHSQKVILLHWITVLLLCPFGYFFKEIAIIAVFCYGWLLAILLFNHGKIDRKVVAAEDRVLSSNQ